MTKKIIEKQWEYHPLIYFSGIPEKSEKKNYIIPSQNAKTWVSTNIEALRILKKHSVSQVYFILDDQPPMGECNADFLNIILPHAARINELKHVNLFGYGQNRRLSGTLLKKDNIKLKQSDKTLTIKSLLLPALWDIDTLIDVLSKLPSDILKPDFAEPLPTACTENIYFISGTQWDKDPIALFRQAAQYSFQLIYLGIFFLLNRLKKTKLLYQFEDKFIWIFASYRGPYPIFQGGLLRNNKRNSDLMQHLSLWDDSNLTYELELLDWKIANPDADKNRLPTARKKL
ncbi:MAG: hypothetical protein ACK5LK_05405 [Chthoniobacterales bacterium]